MTEEINDYAPELLRIKAAVKALEALLPAGMFPEARPIAYEAAQDFMRLEAWITEEASARQGE